MEKWSHHVCGRALFLIFLRCRCQGVHVILAINWMSLDRISTRSHVQRYIGWHLVKARTWSSTCLIESVLRCVNRENDYHLVPFKLYLMTRLEHYRKSLFTPSLRKKHKSPIHIYRENRNNEPFPVTNVI